MQVNNPMYKTKTADTTNFLNGGVIINTVAVDQIMKHSIIHFTLSHILPFTGAIITYSTLSKFSPKKQKTQYINSIVKAPITE